ncbi:MAG TPA: serine hydrolase [Pyrinomonadaceae bacterium]|nr:serine hydrolase [Pyrinomonadaceae bacterium]
MFRSLRQIALILLVLSTAANIALAQDKAGKIDELLKRYSEFGQFNGTALVAENGRVIIKKGYGYANFEWKIPNEADTKFRLASVTKQFTAAVILQLVEQGKIKLDGKLTDYLPDYRKDTGDRITVHQLLNHTSGIPNYTAAPGFFQNDSRDPYTPAEFVKKFASGDLEFEPGSKFNYNNSAYFILGAIIEKVTGKSYADAVKEHIFTPLGMNNSGYDLAGPIIPKRATGYQRGPNGFINAPYIDMSLPYAAGSLYSTAEDLYIWDQALYTDKVVSAKSKELMYKPGLENYGYGLGMGNRELSDKTKVPTIGHSGGINGFSTNIIRFPGEKNLVVLLDNTSQGRFQPAIITAIANILYGKSFETAKRSIGEAIVTTTNEKGVDAAIKQYRDLKASGTKDYDFDEDELNTAGYQLLRSGKPKEAIEVFKLNVEMFPQSSNPYDSLGEAYAEAGEKELAIKNYKRSIELNPKNQGGIDALKRLEGTAPTVDTKTLDRYAGRYELGPGFVLTVTVENGKLHGQATGQGKLAMETVSENKFAVKSVGAEISFVVDDKGTVTGLVLNQGGREMPAKKLP